MLASHHLQGTLAGCSLPAAEDHISRRCTWVPQKGPTNRQHGLVRMSKLGALRTGLLPPYKHVVGAGQECGIGSPLAELLHQHLPTTPVSAASWKRRRKAHKEEVFHSHRGSGDAVPGWLLTLTLFGGSRFAVSSLPRLVVVERGAVLAVRPCCVVLAHALPMDLVEEREQGSPTAKPKESPGHEQCPCTGDTTPARCYYIDKKEG